MTLGSHELSRPDFMSLARGDGTPGAIAALVAAQRSKHVILTGAVAKLAGLGNGPDHALALAGYELLSRAQVADREAAETVLSHPSVGAWALHTLRSARGSGQPVPGARLSGLASVAAAAAIRSGITAEIEVPVIAGRVVLPSLGACPAVGPTAVVRAEPDAAEVVSGSRRVAVRAGSPGWQELRAARAGTLDVLIDDLDPFRMPAPDGTAAERLGPAQAAELQSALRAAWPVLSPASAAEVAAIVRVIVPYQAPEGGYVSTSSPQCFGAVAMSRPPDKYTCAETLVHETQHLKLCALLDLMQLSEPDDGSLFYAPWRTDPRPAAALLQGVYAFTGVSGFWREQCWTATEPAVRERAQAEFARWREGAAVAAGTLLDSGQLTPDGQLFVAEIAGVLDDWRLEPVPDEALVLARRKADRHLTQWHTDNA
jgi:uncharacterized protein